MFASASQVDVVACTVLDICASVNANEPVNQRWKKMLTGEGKMSIAALQKFSHLHLLGKNRLGYKVIYAGAMEVIGMIDVPSKGCFF